MSYVYTKQYSESNNYIDGKYPIKAGAIIQDFYIFNENNISNLDYDDKNVGIPAQIQDYLEKLNCKDISVELTSESGSELKYTARFFC